MAIRLPHDKIPQDDNLVAGMTSLRFKSSLKPAEPPYRSRWSWVNNSEAD